MTGRRRSLMARGPQMCAETTYTLCSRVHPTPHRCGSVAGGLQGRVIPPLALDVETYSYRPSSSEC